MPKITFIGAGSSVFARHLITDLLRIEGLGQGEIALIDIDERRLRLTEAIAERLIELMGKDWTVVSSTERADLVTGSDFVINTVEVGGLANVRHDYDIPLRYGIDQCIGDTIGPGGIFKALRTGPVWLDILRDCERLCPNAWVLNYTNPMSILTLVALTATQMKTVGLCHSVQGTSKRLADYMGIPHGDLTFRCAGINHNSWFVELRRGGEDLYPLLQERARDPEVYEQDPIRFEVMKHLGYFVTESSGHFSEYVPYFRKRPELVERYVRPGYKGESGFYANNWPIWRADNDRHIAEMLAGEREISTEPSHEYGAVIVEAIVRNDPQVIYGNVLNEGLIDNLPLGCVEVACLVDRNGVQPCHFGNLPEQLAALNRAHMAVHALVAKAIVNRDPQSAKYALMLDPLTAAVCGLEEINDMFDEMWDAERDYLGAYEVDRRDGSSNVAVALGAS